MTSPQDPGGESADLPAPPHLVELMERHEAACARVLLGDLPGSLLLEQEEFLLVGPPALAAVHLVRATAEGFDRVRARWEEAFRRVGVPPAVWLSPVSTPADAAERLSRRGYRLAREMRLRILDRERLAERIAGWQEDGKGSHVRVRPMNAQDESFFGHAMVCAYGLSGRAAVVHREAARRAVHRPEVLGLVAEVTGQPAGFAYGVWLDGVCGAVSEVTLPEFRRQGVSWALRHSLFAVALDRSAHYVWYRTDLPEQWKWRPAMAFRHQIWMRWPLPQRVVRTALRPLRRRWFRARRFRRRAG